jgi:hypothetical protein
LAARAGTVLEPLRTARGFDVVQVVAIEHATLGTPATLRAVRMAMISDWLDERRAKANVSWYWGWSTAETPRAG